MDTFCVNKVIFKSYKEFQSHPPPHPINNEYSLKDCLQIIVKGPMTRKWEVGNDPQNKIWEVGDGQKKCGRCIFLKWEVGDEEINVGGGRWIKILGGLLNGVKTHKL